MTDFSLPVTIPDDKTSEFMSALRWHFRMNTATPAELKALATADLRADLIKIFKAYKRHIHETQPPSDEIEIT